ncbi:uncharacterized protein [Phyllobates terribilis]|uniref:uncharacterized protein n=1 Tax=Phyllobates terribilis TaxID=111132 RepID=UPI003CCA83D2
MREVWTAMASLMGVLAFCQTLLSTLFPPELRYALIKAVSRLSNYFSSYCYFDITEIDGVNTNELYNAVQLYLSAAASSTATHRLSLTRALNSSTITFGLSSNDTVPDTFRGAAVQWEHTVTQRQSASFSWRPLPDERRGFTLRLRKHHKSLILSSYLDHIMQRSEEIRRKNEDRYLYTNSRGGTLDSRGPQPWEAVPFKHPSTFDTLAMDPARKSDIMADLKEFAAGQSFYQKTGRAWKRGYLLYGPPGTGKSSMIAAMANYLGYDIYDLELTEVNSNSELRKLLMKTTSKSIIVIEDIDCSISLSNRKSKDRSGRMRNPDRSGFPAGSSSEEGSGGNGGAGGASGNSVTLSGLLNFTDGLWSCCGSERIFVFTTNHIERLDPALLRSGRMDMHIHMGHCNFRSLMILLQNYLGIEGGDDEEVVEEMRSVVEAAEITPADVSEVLLRHRKEKGRAMRELLEEMRRRAADRKRRAVGRRRSKRRGQEEEKDNSNRDKKKNI